MSRMPAGISITSASYGGRYCDTSTTDGFPSASKTSGTTPTAPGERTMSRWNRRPSGASNSAAATCHTWPWCTIGSSMRRKPDSCQARRRRRRGAGAAVPGVASRRARAAAISSRNSGCGRSGRLLNSGCACVPTQNGCPGSSMNSTSCPSGDVPEHHEPALLEAAPVPVVELVAVAVSLGHDGLAVGLGDLRARGAARRSTRRGASCRPCRRRRAVRRIRSITG